MESLGADLTRMDISSYAHRAVIQQAPYPPSTAIEAPVTKLALSLNKKLAIYATSSGCPHLAIGAFPLTKSLYIKSASLTSALLAKKTHMSTVPQDFSHPSFDPARTDAVDSNAIFAIIQRIRSAQTKNSMFSHDIWR